MGGNLSGDPATRGWTLEAFWTPIQYLRLGALYTAYSKFNGASNNYNGFGRNASDNNSIFVYAWFAYRRARAGKPTAQESPMNLARLSMLVTTAALAACANPERSRDLGNPNVSATTLAQQVCSNCHGITGNSTSPNFPNLAGQVEAYTMAQLVSFKSHNRRDPAGFEYMWGLSRGLTAEQISGLAAYYAAQTPKLHAAGGNAARLDAGRKIFESALSDKSIPACSTCHGTAG